MHVEWHCFVNIYEINGWINIPVRSLCLEARETGPMQLLSTTHKLVSRRLFGGGNLDSSFRLMSFGTYKQG